MLAGYACGTSCLVLLGACALGPGRPQGAQPVLPRGAFDLGPRRPRMPISRSSSSWLGDRRLVARPGMKGEAGVADGGHPGPAR